MQREAFSALAELEDYHWWFAGRRQILASMLRRLPLPPNPEIFEVGCGSGGCLGMLAQFGKVWGMEPDPEARKRAQARGNAIVEDGRFPDSVAFEGKQFDVIGMFDVLEHIEDDHGALRALLPRLKPTGHIIISVPAFPFLFGPHDVMHEHYRRYTASVLRHTLEKTGYRPVHWSYFNSLLFAPAAVTRMVQRFMPSSDRADLRMTPPGFTNSLLERMMSSEGPLVSRVSVPFGLSLMAVAQPMSR